MGKTKDPGLKRVLKAFKENIDKVENFKKEVENDIQARAKDRLTGEIHILNPWETIDTIGNYQWEEKKPEAPKTTKQSDEPAKSYPIKPDEPPKKVEKKDDKKAPVKKKPDGKTGPHRNITESEETIKKNTDKPQDSKKAFTEFLRKVSSISVDLGTNSVNTQKKIIGQKDKSGTLIAYNQ